MRVEAFLQREPRRRGEDVARRRIERVGDLEAELGADGEEAVMECLGQLERWFRKAIDTGERVAGAVLIGSLDDPGWSIAIEEAGADGERTWMCAGPQELDVLIRRTVGSEVGQKLNRDGEV